jgi:hypothetical protein
MGLMARLTRGALPTRLNHGFWPLICVVGARPLPILHQFLVGNNVDCEETFVHDATPVDWWSHSGGIRCLVNSIDANLVCR